jgi:hypothetical protein
VTTILRTSETRDILRCEWRWWKAWREGLRPTGTASAALWLGTGVHLGLALWYCGPGTKRGPHPAETFAAWAGDEIEAIKTEARHKDGGSYIIEEKYVPGKELGIAMLEGYVREYGRDEHMAVIQPERAFQVDVPHPRKKGKTLGIYAGTYDLVWRDLRGSGREIRLEEHKTAKAIYTDHLPLDPQAGTYYAIARGQLLHDGLMRKGDRFVGIEYNFLRKALPDERPRNAEGFATNKPVKADYIAGLLALSSETHPGEPLLWTFEGDVNGTHFDEKALTKLKVADLEELARLNEVAVYGAVSARQEKPLFQRLTVERSAHESGRQIERIQDLMIRAKALKDGKLPITKNPTRDCSWDCSFYQLCLLDEQNRADVDEYREAVYDVVDPYADHRKSTEG